MFINSDNYFFISSKILTSVFLIPKLFYCSIHGEASLHLVSAYYIQPPLSAKLDTALFSLKMSNTVRFSSSTETVVTLSFELHMKLFAGG